MYLFLAVLDLRSCSGFSLVAESGELLSSCGARASHCGGFICHGARALGTWASVVVACGLSRSGSQALEHRLSSRGAQALFLLSKWDLPRVGIEPESPALAGRFFTTGPPGKSYWSIIAL